MGKASGERGGEEPFVKKMVVGKRKEGERGGGSKSQFGLGRKGE